MMITKSTPLRTIKELGKDCKMCGNCCKYGAGLLVEDDIPRIAGFLGITEDRLKEDYLDEGEMFSTKGWKPKRIKGGKPYGQCIFYGSKKGCEIHIVKPFQCELTNCGDHAEQAIQWLYVNYFVNPDSPQSIREWASYLKNRDWVIEGGNLHELVPDKERLNSILNYGEMKK